MLNKIQREALSSLLSAVLRENNECEQLLSRPDSAPIIMIIEIHTHSSVI